MLKPSDITITDATYHHRKDIEDRIDTALRNAERGGAWPAIVETPRSGWPTVVVDLVLEAYKAAGWKVEVRPMPGVVCKIMHPDLK